MKRRRFLKTLMAAVASVQLLGAQVDLELLDAPDVEPGYFALAC